MRKLDKLNELVRWFSGLNWDMQIVIFIVLIALVLTRMDIKGHIDNS